MINMLAFKPQASGDYAHLTGWEAYDLYAQTVQTAQAPLGSRLLWAGRVISKPTAMAPTFHAMAFLEYASPTSFVQFLTRGGSNAKARRAGLHGQWLIASTTLEANPLPEPARGHPLVLIELLAGAGRNHAATCDGEVVRRQIHEEVGAGILWCGRCHHHLIGRAEPAINHVVVSWFPDADALDRARRDPRSDIWRGNWPFYLAYTAHSMVDILPALR